MTDDENYDDPSGDDGEVIERLAGEYSEQFMTEMTAEDVAALDAAVESLGREYLRKMVAEHKLTPEDQALIRQLTAKDVVVQAVAEPRRVNLPMMCIHSDEGKAECEAAFEAMLSHLGCTREEVWLSCLVQELEWDYGGATIKGIYNDQWSVVNITRKAYRLPPTETGYDAVDLWVECDLIEHGLAAAYLWFVKDKAESEGK